VAPATAAKTYNDGAGTPAVLTTVTAKCPGALGNAISVAWSENASDSTARDATVTIGTGYSATYENVATIVSTALVVTDPGDPYVTFSKHASGTLVPAVAAAAALTGGADGTAVAADYVGSSSSSVGIRKFYSESVDVDVLFVAECPDSLVDTVNTGLEAYATETDKGMVVLCTPDGDTAAATITNVANHRDDRIVYVWPRVKTTNFYDPDLAEIEVDGNAFAAAAIVSVDPEASPGGAPGAPALSGITGLENEDIPRSTYDDLNEAGVAPFQMVSGLGCILRKGVTTSITSGQTQIFRRRMTDFIADSLAARWQFFVGTLLDVDLAGESLGPNTSGLIGETSQFLADLKRRNRIEDYSVDPFSENTQTNIDDAQWYVAVSVNLFSAADAIVLVGNIGEGVEITA
jgi:hypothetical protein